MLMQLVAHTNLEHHNKLINKVKTMKNKKLVMADYKMLMKRPDGLKGTHGGVKVIYGLKRLTGTIDTTSKDFVWIQPLGSNWRFKVKKEDVMEYDKNNDTLVGTGNSMYDDGVIDYELE